MLNGVRVLKCSFAQLGLLTLAGAAALGQTANLTTGSSLDGLAGSWQGRGNMSFESGATEEISCNGYYTGAGTLSVVIRCKGVSSNFELRSKLQANGGKVLGGWEERTYNAAGAVSGTASAGKLNVQFTGSLVGSLEMSFSSSSQSVSVSVETKGAGITGVRISLNRM